MKKRLVFNGCIIALVMLCAGACSGTTNPEKGAGDKNDKLDVNMRTQAPVSETAEDSEEVSVPFISTVSEDKTEYGKLIPKVDFGLLLLAFKNNDHKGKTMLYTDVKYSDVKNYYEKLLDSGYEQVEKSASKKKDSFNALAYNAENDVYASLKYSKEGLTIMVYFKEG